MPSFSAISHFDFFLSSMSRMNSGAAPLSNLEEESWRASPISEGGYESGRRSVLLFSISFLLLVRVHGLF